MEQKRILLISSSRVHGRGYLDHAETVISDLLAGIRRVLFVPFAMKDHPAYAATVRTRFVTFGYEVDSLHEMSDPVDAIERAESIFIGGGNTFRLLKSLYDMNLFSSIQKRVEEGVPYIGSSAGTNVACPTIHTTNDMPIVEVPSLQALGLVPFQVNPHYLDADPNSTHMGETREQRILEFHEENGTPVVGLREPILILLQGGKFILKGTGSARIFRKEEQPVEAFPETELNELLGL